MILVELLFADSGLVPSVANALGLPLVDWLGGPTAFGVVLLLYLWKNTGYSVILLLAGLVTIPEEQYSAADLDGASGWQKFFYITTPQMWYSVFFAIIFSLINAFKCFREIFLIGGTHPNENIYMLQHFLNNSFENLNYAKLYAPLHMAKTGHKKFIFIGNNNLTYNPACRAVVWASMERP